MRSLFALALLAAAFAPAAVRARTQFQPAGQQYPPRLHHSIHSVTVKFDYDFSLTPPCTKEKASGCVEQFVVYDVRDMTFPIARRTQLFIIRLPRHAKGAVHGITGTSPKLDFEVGKHLIAVVAQARDGTESKTPACTTWITIP